MSRSVIHGAHGWRNSVQQNSSHTYYLGFRHEIIELSEKSGPRAQYKLNFVTGSYRYQRSLGQKTGFEILTGVLIPLPVDVSPSLFLKPVFQYDLSKEFSFQASAGAERSFSRGEVKYSSGKSDVEVTLQQFSAGVGLIWRPWQ